VIAGSDTEHCRTPGADTYAEAPFWRSSLPLGVADASRQIYLFYAIHSRGGQAGTMPGDA
jgi:hypothetical protein